MKRKVVHILAFMWGERKCKMKARYCRGKNWADKEEMNNTIQWWAKREKERVLVPTYYLHLWEEKERVKRETEIEDASQLDLPITRSGSEC